MLKIEVIKFEAQDVITASVAAPTGCICRNEAADGVCYGNGRTHLGPNGEECPGEPYTYPSGTTIYTHSCQVN